jgi:hypothetical protein
MQEAAMAQRRGSRTRALVPVAAGFAALFGMFGLVSSNVLAVNFTTGNKEFKLFSNYLDAQQAAGFLDATTRQDSNNGGVADLGIHFAHLSGLCAIATQDMGLLGTWELRISAGDPVQGSFTAGQLPSGWTSGTQVYSADATAADPSTGETGLKAGALKGATRASAISANNLFINTASLSGALGNSISGLNLGQDAATVATSAGIAWPAGQSTPTAGNFGLYANQLNVAGLDGSTYGINLAGSINLPKLSIKVTKQDGTTYTGSQADCSK